MKQEKTSQETNPIQWVAIGVGMLILIVGIANLYNGSITGYAVQGSSSQGQQVFQSGVQDSAKADQQVQGSSDVQRIALSMKGLEYQPNPLRLKLGVPVELVVNLNTVTGCMRSIQIPDLGVNAYVTQSNNIIRFTPTKKGTFGMRCSMNMGKGFVIVESSDGEIPAPSASSPLLSPPASPMGSCGGGGGGCGCGMAR